MKKLSLTILATLAAAAVLAAPFLHAADRSLPAPEKIVLKNGLTVYYLKDATFPLASFRMFIGGAGSAFEPAGAEGAAGLTASLLTKGAGGMSADEIAEAVDFMGANLMISATEEYASVAAQSLSEYFPKLMGLAARCLAEPAFKEEEFAKERARRIDSLKAAKDNPAMAVRFYFQKAYFGAHPFGHLASGTEASLAKMTVKDVRDFYAARFRPDRSIAAIVGDIDKPALMKVLAETLEIWYPAGTPANDAVPPLPKPRGKDLLLIDKPDATQAYWILGAPGYAMGAAVKPDATVMNTLWGGRFTSWISTELRIKRGLTYGASSSFRTWAAGGIFQASSYTKNDKIGEMLDITFGLLEKGASKGFAAEEVESARNYILGQFPPTLQTVGDKAGAYVRLAYYRLGFDYYDKYLAAIGKVTQADVNKAAAALLPRSDYVLVVVGKAADIKAQLQKFGTWKERSISTPGF